MTTLKYSTTKKLAEVLGIVSKIPSWTIGTAPVNETVGVGDDSKTLFYLDHKNIIKDSQILYYGSDVTATNTLTEITHYTVDLDSGKINLTAEGVTLLSTNNIYSSYSYISNEMEDSYLNSVLDRAEKEVNLRVNSIFTDGTATNPIYVSTTEIQSSPGYFRDQIINDKKPLIDIVSSLNGAVDISQNTIDLSAADGSKFPTSGYVVIGNEVISYTGITTDQLTGVVRGVLDSDASTHEDGDEVHSTILFLSESFSGNNASWVVQPWDTGMHASSEGLFYLFDRTDRLFQQDVANRVRLIYYYGYDTIPSDITRLTLLLAKRQLIQDNIGKSMIAGRNEFKPEMFNVDMAEIKSIVNAYIVFPMGNT